MVKIPDFSQRTRDAIYGEYERRNGSGHRPHLGASLIGRECERELWYVFRWVLSKAFSGRMLRLFKTGDHEEPRMVSDLRNVGVTVLEVDPETGRQWNVRDDTGHFGGSLDGIGCGIHEAPASDHVLEFKTHSDKSFTDMAGKVTGRDQNGEPIRTGGKGVFISKPEHYAQMQTYMHLKGIDRAFYMAKNKNTDELYTERIKYDAAYATRTLAKAKRIINSPTPPDKAFTPGFWKCRFCDFSKICHDGAFLAERNCRTCIHSTPVQGGAWTCAIDGGEISDQTQREGCTKHRYIPALVPHKQVGVDGENILYEGWTDDGRRKSEGDDAKPY